MLREAAYYFRMAVGLHKFIRTPPASDPEGLIRSQLENREHIFLDTVRRVVFADAGHPYHQMFRLAGCGYGDLRESVRRNGLESTLTTIQRQGVYLTSDEFKGKTPVVRSGRHIPTDPNSFLNPLVSGFFETVSSGSRSAGTRTREGTAYQIYLEAYEYLIQQEFQTASRDYIAMMPLLPAGWGIYRCVAIGRTGRSVDRWFASGGTLRDSGHYRLATRFLVLEAKLLGASLPFPTCLPPNDFTPVARWIARRRTEGTPGVVRGVASPCVRVAAAALEKSLDIQGTTFLVSGEALTDRKRAVVEQAGGKVFPNYFTNEFGPVGFSCRQIHTGNRVHLCRDAIAVISRRRLSPLTEVEVDSLLFTHLLPTAPRILINLELDDCAAIEKSRCSCAFSRAGFTELLRDIYSFSKLTGHGTSLVGSDVLRILEERLPSRFGGSPMDYQLVEDEDRHQTRITLRVSPRLGVASSEEIKTYFLGEIRRLYGGSLTVRDWRNTGAIEVAFAEPFVTQTGKVLPLHLLGSGRTQKNAT